jgi:hypothetical protein
VTAYATPGRAARGDTPERFARVVGVVVRGDRAIVALRMNDRPAYEIDTTYCERGADGLWYATSGGNSTGGKLMTGPGRATVIGWEDDAPAWAVAARFACGARELVVPVVDECAFSVFDDVELDEDDPFGESARRAAWVRADGSEEPSGHHFPSPEQRARRRAIVERLRELGGFDPADPVLRELAGGTVTLEEPRRPGSA